MRVALDTNRLVDLFQGDRPLAGLLATCDEVWIPWIVCGEFQAGLLGGSRGHHNLGLLQALLAKPTADVLLPTMETADHYARLFVQLKRAGTPIPDNHLWIAALALQHDLILITRDKHFECVPQLRRA